jgi:hypothetical protein
MLVGKYTISYVKNENKKIDGKNILVYYLLMGRI